MGMMDRAIQDARATPRDQILGIVEKEITFTNPNKKYPLVIKFNPRLPPLSKLIHQLHMHVLELAE